MTATTNANVNGSFGLTSVELAGQQTRRREARGQAEQRAEDQPAHAEADRHAQHVRAVRADRDPNADLAGLT